MKPERLTLLNIGPFRGTHTVDFTALGDIFLVYGKTGAGKTTIFDAISFAFYGKVPGSRNGIERQMRSQFADEDAVAGVELTFTTGGKRYRIKRTLAYEKIGVRSGKPVLIQEESTLEEFLHGLWENESSTNKSDTDKKILDIIKLSAEEFSRIVLLPQGEFARFLKLNSNERKDVLAKLFPVEQYTRVTELSRTRAKESALRVAETENAILLLGAEFNALSWADDRAHLASLIAELRNAQMALQKNLEEKSALLEKAKAADAKQKQKETLSRTLEALNKNEELHRANERELDAAIRAAPLYAEFSALESARERQRKIGTEKALAKSEKAERERTLRELERDEPRMREAARKKDSLLVKKEQLQTAVKIAETLEALENEYDSTKKELGLERKKIAELESEGNKGSSRLAELADDIAAMDERTKNQELARDELEKRKKIKEVSQEYAREMQSRNAHQEAVKNIDGAIAQNRGDLAIAKAECAALEAEIDSERKSSLAATLAEQLEEGKPCPVCGSLHHPAPAARADTGFSRTERLEAGKRRCENLEIAYSKLVQERASRGANLATAEDRLILLVGGGLLSGDVPNPEAAGLALENAVRRAQDATDKFGRSRAAFREAEVLRAKAEETESARAKIRVRVSELETRAAEQKSGISHAKARYLEAFRQNEGNGNQPQTEISGTSDASDELERCEATLLEIEALISSWESRLTETKMRVSALDGKTEELGKSLESLDAEISAIESGFIEHCAKAAFADSEAVRGAVRTGEAQKKLETDIAAFKRELADTKTLLESVNAELSGWNGPNPETVESDIEEARRTLEETGRALEQRAAELSGLDGRKSRWDDLEKERAFRSSEAARLKALSDDLTGNNPAKTSFDAWILGMYLEEITAYANTRLERMSEGRYRIKLNESYRKGNSLAGLELEILDAHTGKTRPAGTLSGGETFMTSISLALGLADSIQSRAGGIQLDAVFIDEGFGSLDESSLERAITILDEIRGSRMVGLISHVGELRSRIPNRIEIIKTGAGSEIRADTV